MASRVMPGSGPVSTRSSPTSPLISVDLPALGRPTMASWRGGPRLLLGGFLHGGSGSIAFTLRPSARSKHGAERVIEIVQPLACSAEIAIASPRPRPKASARARSRSAPFVLVGDDQHGARLAQQPAKWRSSGVMPARASTRRRATSASAIASSVCRRMRPARVWAPASSRPAVSMAVKSSPARGPALRGDRG